jgi:nitroimidazol reductase NimA-like FMN-containing flavoprotein (pyridoxamine 5'-phosphate oxidase superfamily)
MPATNKDLIAWEGVEARLRDARVYWVATSGPGAKPHVRPVDGLYVDGRLFVGGSPATRWVRDLESNPEVSVHLDGDDVVILEGMAELLEHGAEPALAERLAAESARKYPEYGMTTESYLSGPGPFAISPRVGFAWSSFPKDLTKFRFG